MKHDPYEKECPANKNRDSENPLANVACHCFAIKEARQSSMKSPDKKEVNNMPSHENEKGKKCHCGSVQFDYAGRCLACKNRNSQPVVKEECEHKEVAMNDKKTESICLECGKSFVAEKCDSIEKAGVVCKDCFAPPQESKASWECIDNFGHVFSNVTNICFKCNKDVTKSAPLQESQEENWKEQLNKVFILIENLLSKAKTEEREFYENCPQCTGLREIYRADLVKKVEAKKITGEDLVRFSGSQRVQSWNSALDEVIKILTPQE